MSETHEHRLKRLKIRAWRRGTKEMDLILGSFVDAKIGTLNAAELDALEALMAEQDLELYTWFTGQVPVPAEHSVILLKISNEIKLF